MLRRCTTYTFLSPCTNLRVRHPVRKLLRAAPVRQEVHLELLRPPARTHRLFLSSHPQTKQTNISHLVAASYRPYIFSVFSSSLVIFPHPMAVAVSPARPHSSSPSSPPVFVVHGRQTGESVEPRKSSYVYRDDMFFDNRSLAWICFTALPRGRRAACPGG